MSTLRPDAQADKRGSPFFSAGSASEPVSSPVRGLASTPGPSRGLTGRATSSDGPHAKTRPRASQAGPKATAAGTGDPKGRPLLDTLGLRRQPRARTTDSAVKWATGQPRIEWLRRVDGATADYREHKAREYGAKARRRFEMLVEGGMSPKDARKKAGWFKSRERGQRFRFKNAETCGETMKALEISCVDCGQAMARPLTCGATLACVKCRGRLQAKRRRKVADGQRAVSFRARRAGLTRRNRRGGRWSDKFVTLTIPHLDEHGIGDRIALVHSAWPHFLKALNAWFRETEPDTYDLAAWYGSHEWTLGSDHKGHPHVQLWFFCPYLPHEMVTAMWRNALDRVGFSIFDTEQLQCDVREMKDVKGGVFEVVKYVVKDVVAEGEFLSAEVYGELYEALDGRRLRRGSSGFLKLCEQRVPCDCGSCAPRCIKVVSQTVVPDAERRAIQEERSCGP